MKPAFRLLLLFAAASVLSQFPARAEGGKISCSGTSMQYSIEGGRLKRVKDDERDRTVSHNYEGEIKPGETITIRYAGLSAMKSAGGNDGAVAINPMAKKRKIEGMLKEAHADDGQGCVSGHLSYTVEPDVVRIDVYVTFTSYTYRPMVGLAPFTTSAWVTYTVVEAEPKKPAEEKRQSTGPTTSPGYSNDDDGGGDKDYEEDNEASFVTEVIPYLIPAAVIAAIIGITVSAGNKKKGGKNKKQDASQDDQPYYSMHFYKNFGNTIIAGEPPQKIYARIVKTVKGVDTPDAMLTSMIRISSGAFLKVVPTGVSNGWMTADVSAPEADPLPEEGIVVCHLAGGNGSYTNRIHFRVSQPGEVILAEQSLVFPAGKGYEKYMGFGLNDVSQPPADVTVRLMDGAEAKFSTTLQQDLENPLMFRIFVKETCRDVEDAGKAEQFRCAVDVKLQSGRPLPTKIFYIYRMHLGLNIELDALKAYLVDFDSTFDSEILPTDPKVKKKFGESRIKIKLIVEDKETGQLHNVIPDSDPVITIEDVPDNKTMFADKYGAVIERPCELMNFKYEFRGILESDNQFNEVIWWGIVRSTRGYLLPPNRAKAKVTATVTYKEETFTDTVTVPVISQPYRDRISYAEYQRLLKEDFEKLEKLKRIRKKIASDVRFSGLLPFYYKVEAMVEGYHRDFGFYEPDYERVIRIFDKYCSGEIGHYFINENIWRPDWTEADENFDAFLATFSSIENSWTGLGARIVLGFVTAGASELILTPYSALVKMKAYVNKGGDSAWEAFRIASYDVLFWEGAFRLAGAGLKYANQKLGITNYLKGKYDKIVDGYKKWKETKELGKRLGSKPSYSTRGLGESVKEAGAETAAVKNTARQNANRAIEETRKSAASGGSSSGGSSGGSNASWEEMCARRARQDSQKILDEFTRVMNNPTASADEIRRATLALQGNKGAQTLLRESSSDLLRANFNHSMQKIYQEVDKRTIEALAKKLNVKPDQIQPWNGASSNTFDDLFQGRKIAADRDVTYQVLKDGKWVDIEESLMHETYAECFTEYNYNFLPADRQQAIKTLQKLDQAVVNGATGLESYGSDLGRIVDPALRTQKLADPERVASTFVYKCKSWLNQGKAAQSQAESLRAYGLVDEAMSVAGYGQNLIKEGIRQNVKQFKNILLPRMQVLAKKGVGGDYSKLLEKINILEGLGVPCPPGATPVSLEEATRVLSYKYGTTVEKVVEECANLITEVNEYL